MKEKWLIALYKINEIKRLETNLLIQNFEYYSPKITIKKTNSNPKEEVLFPGYIFINTSFENYSTVKYTKGIKSILKFGDNISYISYKDIKAMRMAEEASKIDPIASQIEIGQEATILNGTFKGSIVKICSLPSKKRVGILLNFLGSIRKATISENELTF